MPPKKEIIVVIFTTFMLRFISTNSALAQISCHDVKYGSSNYHEKMDELAERAGLPDNYWSRYHESFVSDLCNGNIKGVDKLIARMRRNSED
jgi:ABC-type dipeptide/oligopeptide/nickel transport system permease component